MTIPNKTVSDKMLLSARQDYAKDKNNIARSLPEQVFVEYQLDRLSRLEFLLLLSEAIEARLKEGND